MRPFLYVLMTGLEPNRKDASRVPVARLYLRAPCQLGRYQSEATPPRQVPTAECSQTQECRTRRHRLCTRRPSRRTRSATIHVFAVNITQYTWHNITAIQYIHHKGSLVSLQSVNFFHTNTNKYVLDISSEDRTDTCDISHEPDYRSALGHIKVCQNFQFLIIYGRPM